MVDICPPEWYDAAALSMNIAELILIALALAVDATVYSFSYGLVLREGRRKAALRLALCTGGFQAGMPLLGYWGGSEVRQWVDTWAPWIVLGVFGILGASIIRNAWKKAEGADVPKGEALGLSGLLLVGIATSIDAMAVGACMALGALVCSTQATHLQLFLCAGTIGAITFAGSFAAFHSARFLHHLPTRWLETAAGLILIFLGIHQC